MSRIIGHIKPIAAEFNADAEIAKKLIRLREDQYGNRRSRFGTQLHNDDGPAATSNAGRQEWWFHGLRHRAEGTAVITAMGGVEYWQYGQLHRAGGLPARIQVSGRKDWYVDGFRHRDDGPAIEFPDGTKKWYQRGLLHRQDGPAIVNADGSEEWFNQGKPWPEGPEAVRQQLIESFATGMTKTDKPVSMLKPVKFGAKP